MRKAGKLAMTTVVLKRLLHIPEDTNVRDIWIDHERDIVYVLMEDGQWLPEVPEGGVPPQVVQPILEKMDQES